MAEGRGTWRRRWLLSPSLGMDGYGAGLVQTLGDDHVAEGAIEPRHLYHVKALIGPVDVSCRERGGRW